jgi:hypothetical protein
MHWRCLRSADRIFIFVYSDLHVSLGQLDLALVQLARSFQAYRDPKLIIRQANLAASAGKYADGLIFLERSREAEKDGRLLQGPTCQRLRDWNRNIKGCYKRNSITAQHREIH